MRRILLSIVTTVSGVVLLLQYPTSLDRSAGTTDVTAAGTTTTGTTGGAPSAGSSAGSDRAGSASASSSGSSGASGGSSGTSSGTSSGGSSAGTGLTDGRYTASTSMRYGTVSVTVTVSGGRVTAASGSQDSQDGHSRQVSSAALPTLDDEATTAGTASIAMVSHATFTSEAYAQSLQAALDQARP
ncbi:FMN-binding protein [Cellulomonas sp. HD19AZ1]|uniref:FMN-binding protein n=1 Tax=Cellulomonas sp. HD19AZ1 TaxID=2559593 RepID=UPI001070A1C8|nr:FMN-binding protein [Cellulomonas sp. HD19AZ1]TFH70509.1 FMN-binding protein [Cellulomonas sp. HD19AZ1]